MSSFVALTLRFWRWVFTPTAMNTHFFRLSLFHRPAWFRPLASDSHRYYLQRRSSQLWARRWRRFCVGSMLLEKFNYLNLSVKRQDLSLAVGDFCLETLDIGRITTLTLDPMKCVETSICIFPLTLCVLMSLSVWSRLNGVNFADFYP